MKPLKLFSLILISISAHQHIGTSIFAQSSNVQSVAGILRKKNMDLAEAKKFIDLAAENPSTANDVKMWYYRGKVYMAIYRDTTGKYKPLDLDAPEKATISFMNCIKLDTKKEFVDDARPNLMSCAIKVFDEGIRAYEKQDFPKSIKMYNLVLEIMPMDEKKDLTRNNVTDQTIYLYLYYTNLAAKDNEKAKSYLQKLIDANYNDPKIYMYMSEIYIEEKNMDKAISYIELGRSKFEENKDLINAEFAMYKKAGKSDVLLKRYDDAIAKDDQNHILYYLRGRLYDEMNKMAEAEKDYKKSIELEANYFPSNNDLAIVLFNQGVEIINAAEKLTSNEDYAKEQTKSEEKFKEAIQYFETAHQLNQKDTNTMELLKLAYARVGNNAGVEDMKKKLEKK